MPRVLDIRCPYLKSHQLVLVQVMPSNNMKKATTAIVIFAPPEKKIMNIPSGE